MRHTDHRLREWAKAASNVGTLLGVAMIGMIWAGLAWRLDLELKTVVAAAKQNTDNLARVIEEHAVRSIEQTDKILLSLREAYQTNPDRFDIGKASVYLDNMVRQIAVVGPDGILKESTPPPPVGAPIDLSDRDTFRVRLDSDRDDLFISKPVILRTSGRSVIPVSRRIFNPDRSFGGVIVVSIDQSYLQRFYESIDIGRDGTIMLAGLDGMVRAARGYKTFEPDDFFLSRSFRVALRENSAGFFLNRNAADGVERLVSYRNVGRLPLIVAVGLSQPEVLADYWRDRRKYLLIATGWTVVILITVGLGAVRNRKLVSTASSLRRSNTLLDSALQNMPQGLCMFDAKQRLIIGNQRHAEIYGLTAEQTEEGTGLRELLEARATVADCGPDAKAFVAERLAMLSTSECRSYTDELKNGRTIAVSRRPTPDGGWISIHEDITEREQMELERDRSQRFLDTIVEHVPAPIFVKNADDLRYILVNQAGERFWGISRAEIIGKTARDFFTNHEADLIAARDQELLRSGVGSFDERQINTPGNGVRSVISKRLIVDGDGGKSKYLIGVIEDVTERKRAEERIADMARRDALTGVANRTGLREKLEEAAARLRECGEPFTILMLDLDGFKYINDSIGHAAGDELLKELAQRLQSSLDGTGMLARLGGDEFAIVQVGGSDQRERAITLALKVLDVVIEPFDLDGHHVHVGTSVGIAMAPENGAEPGDLMKKADMALYRVKSEGRNDFRFFDEEMSNDTTARHRLLNDLRSALSHHEFELFYQPMIDAKTARLCGAEALIRWRHPVEGLIQPDRFIWLAEEAGLMESLGAWILERACTDAVSWPQTVKVSVNLSAVQFRSGKLFDVILCALVESGLPPERLELEITESLLLENKESYAVMIQQLKNIGISIVLDDFGTGYSSLSYLTRFPFDKIKIDKSFTQGLAHRADCAAVVASVLTLARGLDIAVTAEGVETQEQSDLLRAAGVDQVQGFLYGEPCPVGELDFSASERTGQAVAAA